MPLQKRITTTHFKIGIWDIQESLHDLIQLGKKLDVSKFRSNKRKKEFLAGRLLIKELLGNYSVTYNKYGAPEIKGDDFISISHSKNLAAAIVSKKKVGLDIEKISEKPLELSSKFIEKPHLKDICQEKATLIWCCKEAIFKWYQKNNINFVRDIKIRPFVIKNEGTLIATLKSQEHILHYKRIETHFLVYVCK